MENSIQTIVKRLPLMAAILGAGLAMAQKSLDKSSNISQMSVHAKADVAYFQYTGSIYSDAGYTNAANWNYMGTTAPSSNPCTNGSNHVCVLEIDQDDLDGASGSSETDRLANYLSSVGASSFVNSNATYKKP